tara:strand:- start:175 stop:645 length:471 start_codon:yes stop_codon:yes gene_type:complete
MTKPKFETPAWDNESKTRMITMMVTTDEDGKESRSTATVNKFDDQKNINPDWDSIITEHGIKGVNENTDKRMAFRRQKQGVERRAAEEREKAKELERLFNSKLACFEILEIKNSKNRKLRSKIRKAKNEIELMAYTSLLVMEEYQNGLKESAVATK